MEILKIVEKGKLSNSYKERDVAEYMKGEKIDISVNLNIGKKILLLIQWTLLKNTLKLMQIIEVNILNF